MLSDNSVWLKNIIVTASEQNPCTDNDAKKNKSSKNATQHPHIHILIILLALQMSK
jgi:hypothetical protein